LTADFQPYPLKPSPSGQDWGEETLLSDLQDRGFCYFVQYNTAHSKDADIMFSVLDWCEEQGWIKHDDFDWVGGRFYYELCFRDEEHAMLFKLAHGI